MNDAALDRLAVEERLSEPPPPTPTTRMRPAQNWALVGIFLLLALAGIAYAQSFLMPVVLAFLLALVFSPVRRFLSRRGVPSWVSAVLIVGALLGMIIAGIAVLSAPAADWINRAPSIFSEVEAKIRDLRGVAETVAQVGERVDQITKGPGAERVPEVVVRESGTAASLAWLAPLLIAQIVFVLVLLFFLLSSGDMIYEKMIHVLPTLTDKKRALRIARDIELNLSHYLFTITVINAALGLAIGAAMWLIGMPTPLLFAVLGFALNYIPYAGAVAGVLITTLVALLSLNGPGDAAMAGGAYLLLTTIEGQLITPYFVGRQLRLNTVVVFLSVALWAWLWSVVGMIVATPLLAAIRTFCEHIPSLENVGAFLSARGEEQEDDSGTGAA